MENLPWPLSNTECNAQHRVANWRLEICGRGLWPPSSCLPDSSIDQVLRSLRDLTTEYPSTKKDIFAPDLCSCAACKVNFGSLLIDVRTKIRAAIKPLCLSCIMAGAHFPPIRTHHGATKVSGYKDSHAYHGKPGIPEIMKEEH